MEAERYLDRGERENELRQVIGQTSIAYNITQEDVVIFGSRGILVAGSFMTFPM